LPLNFSLCNAIIGEVVQSFFLSGYFCPKP
jgi:hypothetical protein